jgi:hypothetical protein
MVEKHRKLSTVFQTLSIKAKRTNQRYISEVAEKNCRARGARNTASYDGAFGKALGNFLVWFAPASRAPPDSGRAGVAPPAIIVQPRFNVSMAALDSLEVIRGPVRG